MRKLCLIPIVACILLRGRPAQAQSVNMPPTISDIPAPIIGSAEPVSGGGILGNFLYLDAIDLEQLATDDTMAPSRLMWTYTGSLVNGGSNYLINGVPPINPVITDPTSPSAAMVINWNDLDPVPGKDMLKNTITIRNRALSPLPMGTVGTDPGATPGILATQTQPVTFFCSDGDKFSSATVFFYTDNKGNDRLSTGCSCCFTRVDKIPTVWATNPMEWSPGGTNQISRSQWNGSGVCLNGTLSGANYGSVISAWPYFNLAANRVYRFKLKMVSSQANPMNTMFWDIVLENYEPHTGRGLNLYMMDMLVFPNEGGANALTSAGATYTIYWVPPAVATPQWNNPTTGAFTASRDAVNDPRLRFRLMDADSVAGAQCQFKSGSVCLQEIEIASGAMTRAQVVQNLVNITSLAPNTGAGGNVECLPLIPGTSAMTFANGTLTITPADPVGNADGRVMNLTEIRPATDATYSCDPYDPKSLDNFPIAWKTGKILRLKVDLSAPTAADEANPWDAVVLLFNTMTNEINAESYQTANLGCGSPKQGAPQTYTMFFYTGNETKSPAAGFHRLRCQVRFLNSHTTNFPNGQTTNTGSVRIHGIRVDEVTFK